jgi:hypothetical protein
MSQFQSSLNPGWKYVDPATIHVAGDGTILGGCTTSYYTGDALAAGRSKSAVTALHASEQAGQKRDIADGIIRSIYADTVEKLDPATWSMVQQNTDQGKATFATASKSGAQRYLDTELSPDSRTRTARTEKLRLLTGSKHLPSCSAIGLVPARSTRGDPSFKPRADIVWKSPSEIDHVKVELPTSIKNRSIVYPSGSLSDVLSGSASHPETVPVTFTGITSWWRKDIVAESEADLKPSLQFELSRVAALSPGATRQMIQADVEENIASVFAADLERKIKFRTSVARDLEVQKRNHPRLRESSRWRVHGVPGEPTLLLEMQPVAGQEESLPENILIKTRGRAFGQT